ncbi:unnamed protein product [Didymodactylos carnosus]|uniref:Glycosyl hydrolase family 13 catalytic domain-containing protein n=1 Tax=Didymodactylos carnosus TaxID=1234261 RepID=A0A813TGQ9_9BILA|nr:unnamed protein product [Didymodactylos carnosus]CAF0812399.1 unnamed protein product [Didymodactylos carnosus]CAF3500220.1 unnamed protein product [Didymodactylos carnosus]CAF3598159.1 unnamed protein product [Didymodactylos carnosus]
MNTKLWQKSFFSPMLHFQRRKSSTMPDNHPSACNKDHKLIIYQILTRLFGNRNLTNKFYGTIDENGVGKLNDINNNVLKELKQFGYTHVWYTGVIEHALMTDYSSYGIRKDNPYIVKGLAGSPYAVKDYYDINPDLAVNIDQRMSEFEQLVKRSHENGLNVLIDFIPNHVARQYYSDRCPEDNFGSSDDCSKEFSATNDFYYITDQEFQLPQGIELPPSINAPEIEIYTEHPVRATGNDVFNAKPLITDWFETVKLNYGVDYKTGRSYFDPIPPLWHKLLKIIKFWCDKGVDGFRCDMCEMVPADFWNWLISNIRKDYSDRRIIFIGEIYRPDEYKKYIEYGYFDYLYDKVGLYDTLRWLIEGTTLGNANDITKIGHDTQQRNMDKNMLRFLENHDEIRIASKQFANTPWKALPAMVVTATMHNGPFMIYFGQELGVASNVDKGFQSNDGRTTIFDYWDNVPEIQAWYNDGKCDGKLLTTDQLNLRQFYGDLISLVHKYKSLHCLNSKFVDLQYANIKTYDTTKVYSYFRYHPNDEYLLFICNFDYTQEQTVELHIPDEMWNKLQLDSSQTYQMNEVFLDRKLKLELKLNENIQLKLPQNTVYVFEILK